MPLQDAATIPTGGVTFPTNSGEGIYYDKIKKQRAGAVRPVAPVNTAMPTYGPDPYAAIQARQQAAQQAAQNAAQAADYDALIARLRQDEQFGENDIQAQLANLGTQKAFNMGEANRNSALSREVGRRGLAGRGLSSSGVRLGFEGRSEADLARLLGNIGLEYNQNSDALQRALEQLQRDTESQVAQTEQKKKALGVS
jgi:hypothetical protein